LGKTELWWQVVLTWSVLSFVAVVDPYISNSRHPSFYPINRHFITRRELEKMGQFIEAHITRAHLTPSVSRLMRVILTAVFRNIEQNREEWAKCAQKVSRFPYQFSLSPRRRIGTVETQPTTAHGCSPPICIHGDACELRPPSRACSGRSRWEKRWDMARAMVQKEGAPIATQPSP
jgi:hypothetical protein